VRPIDPPGTRPQVLQPVSRVMPCRPARPRPSGPARPSIPSGSRPGRRSLEHWDLRTSGRPRVRPSGGHMPGTSCAFVASLAASRRGAGASGCAAQKVDPASGSVLGPISHCAAMTWRVWEGHQHSSPHNRGSRVGVESLPCTSPRNPCNSARQGQHCPPPSSERTWTCSLRSCAPAATRSWDPWPAMEPSFGTRSRPRASCPRAGPTSRKPGVTGSRPPTERRSSTGPWGRPRPRPRCTRQRSRC
jgi:hypothetical protein